MSKRTAAGGFTAAALVVATSALGLTGCVNKSPPEKKIDPAYVAKNLLSAPPGSIQHPVHAVLGGSVEYLGCDVKPAVVARGESATVVHYWQVAKAPGSGWRVFTHLTGQGKGDWMNLDRSDMRLGYPPNKWKAGDIIRDQQTFTLDSGWASPYAQVLVGLYRAGGDSVEDRMPVESGPVDSERRVKACRFKVGRKGGAAGASAPLRAPEYKVRRTHGPIKIDGRAGETDWQNAPWGPDFAVAAGGASVVGAARGKLLWDGKYLYAFIHVEDKDVRSQYVKRDDPLWKEDVVELFIDADKNQRGYVELQVNPHNAEFDSWWPTTRAQPGHPEWNSHMRSAVVVDGTIDDSLRDDKGWDAEIAIPLGDVKGADAAMKVNIPPEVGDSWRMNVVRVDKPAHGPLGASSWSPITIQDFHALGRMFEVVFADKDGNVMPAGAAPKAPAAGSPEHAATPAPPKKTPAVAKSAATTVQKRAAPSPAKPPAAH